MSRHHQGEYDESTTVPFTIQMSVTTEELFTRLDLDTILSAFLTHEPPDGIQSITLPPCNQPKK